jgi:predicted membrane protein
MSESAVENADLERMKKYPLIGYFYRLPSRLLSFLAALGLTALMLLVPTAIATDPSNIDHGLLTLCMIGIAAGFVHGFGFVPRNLPARLLFSPAIGWPLMAIGILMIFRSGS